MSQGFSASGTVKLTFTGSYPPLGSRINFIVTAGNLACAPSNTPPTVSISPPAANAAFSAPASIVVTAQAADPDGSVASVQFLANGASIGTATASPYTITWSGAAPGPYTLTAIATDNQGATTTSAPVAISVTAAQARLYFVQVDHLNTPRLVADAAGTTVWRWDQQEPFGSNPADENPSGLGAFDLPLRLPGQYFDKETNLHYNYFRDYDPAIGQYLETDRRGLQLDVGLYRYAWGNPLTVIDIDGDAPKAMWGRSASLGIGATFPVGVVPFLSASLGSGVTIRQCCNASGNVINQFLWTFRAGAGLGASMQASASGRGIIPVVQFGGFPSCIKNSSDKWTSSVDAVAGILSGRWDIDNGVANIGVAGGGGLSAVLNIFERQVVIAESKSPECCTPQ